MRADMPAASLFPPTATGPLAIEPARRAYLQQVIHDALVPFTARVGLTWISVLLFLGCFAPFLASSHPIVLKAGGQWSSPLLKHLEAMDVVLPVAFITGLVLVLTRRLSVGMGLGLVLWVSGLTYAFVVWPSVPEYWVSLRGARGDLLSAPVAAALLSALALLVLAVIVLPPLLVLPRRAVLFSGLALSPLLLLLLIVPLRPPQSVVFERYREMEKAGTAQVVIHTVIPFSPTDRLRDEPESRLQPPSAKHWAGTDNYGADLLSRMVHASRIALAIGFIATGIAVVIGVIVGGLMGYFSGAVDLVGMRIIEILEAIPTLVLLIAITASYGRNLYLMMAVIGLLRWTGDARFIRAEFLKLRNQDFVQAATAAGLPLRSILFRHMLPNGVSPVLVSASFGVASAILLESTLSFLGLGLVDEPSWGEMLNQARAGGAGFNWWIATFPGLLIFLTVFSYNLIGEAVRDALDPKLMKRD